MSMHWTYKPGKVYRIPPERVRRKVEKPEYRARYERHCLRNGEEAVYNTMGKLCWIERL